VTEQDVLPQAARRKKTRESGGKATMGSALARSYDGIRNLILTYEIKPNDKLNELELAKRFGVSRTPIREALNRLVVEQLLGFEPSLGFYRPKINLQEIVNLYELRVIIETEGVRLATKRATDAEIDTLIGFWTTTHANKAKASNVDLIANDEAFHERLVGLSHNEELVEVLRRLNARIHFIRWADSLGDGKREESYRRHLELLEVLRKRDEEKTIEILRNIIVKRQNDLVDILKEGAARLYIY
jgi:DNA-binding GntR family transcriptional regulator